MDKRSAYHFVMVHGDCHGAWCWYKVVTLLRDAGHKVTALDMACCGVQPKRVEDVRTLSDYSKPLMEFMEALMLDERVVLVGHSRGGYDISIAMEKFSKKVAAAVFVTAAMPGPDLDIPTICKEFDKRLDSPMDNKFSFGKGPDEPPTSFIFGPKFLATNLYTLSPPEDLTLATSLIRPSPLVDEFHRLSKETKLTKENYGSVPRVYIVCEQDKSMKVEMQRWLIDNNPPNEVKMIMASGHMAMMSKPQELYSYLLEISHKYIS